MFCFRFCIDNCPIQKIGACVLPLVLGRLSSGKSHEQILSLSNTFSGGIMVGTALLHLLPESIERNAISQSVAFFLCGLCFLLSWFVFGMFLPKIAHVDKKQDSSALSSATDSETNKPEEQHREIEENALPQSGHGHTSIPEILSVIFVGALRLRMLF
jgi:hypothetical protein